MHTGGGEATPSPQRVQLTLCTRSHVPPCFYGRILSHALSYHGDTSACIKERLPAHTSLYETLEGFFYLQQHQKEAQPNASELLWWQPDHVCLHFQTDPCCWHMCGTGHPLSRYVHFSALFTFLSPKQLKDCSGPASCPINLNRKNIEILLFSSAKTKKKQTACYIYFFWSWQSNQNYSNNKQYRNCVVLLSPTNWFHAHLSSVKQD